jgi:hypothetical protein
MWMLSGDEGGTASTCTRVVMLASSSSSSMTQREPWMSATCKQDHKCPWMRGGNLWRAHHSVHSPCAGQSLAALANWQPQGLSPTVATSVAPVMLAATAATATAATAAAAAAVVHLQA